MTYASVLVMMCFFIPPALIFTYICFQLFKYYKARAIFSKGTTNIKAEVYEISEGSQVEAPFYIIRAKYTDNKGNKFQYRSKKIRGKLTYKVGDLIEVTV